MFLAGGYIRDQLFDADSDSIEDRRNRFLKARSTVETRLMAISQNVGPEQRAEFDQVRMEIEAYWKLAEAVFNDADGETPSVRELQRELNLRRSSVLTILATIGSVNESAVEERQHEIETAQDDLIQYTRRMILVSSLLGLIVAVAAGYGNHLLQKQADQQRSRIKHAEQELRSLSSQLVHAQEKERRAISRELHDEVGQTLTGLGIELAHREHLRDGPQPGDRPRRTPAKRLTD